MSRWQALFADLAIYWPQILSGLGNTLLLAGTVTITGLLCGVLVFCLTLNRNRVVRRVTEAYISFFIGTPLIVLLFLMYYGLPQWGVSLSPFTVAVIGFTFNVAAYNARYLMTAYNALDESELEAARAQGFAALQVFRWITLPQTLRLAIPGLTNQAILNIKDSSVAFLIQYTDFFAQMQELAAHNFQYFQVYLLAGVVYLVLVSGVVIAARWLERRFVLPVAR